MTEREEEERHLEPENGHGHRLVSLLGRRYVTSIVQL